MFPEDHEWWLRPLTYVGLATSGGMLGHLMRSLDSSTKIIWWHTLLKGFAAGFVGLLVFFLCQALKLEELWTAVVVGVFGWLGADATIIILEKVILKKLGITPTLKGTEHVDGSE